MRNSSGKEIHSNLAYVKLLNKYIENRKSILFHLLSKNISVHAKIDLQSMMDIKINDITTQKNRTPDTIKGSTMRITGLEPARHGH